MKDSLTVYVLYFVLNACFFALIGWTVWYMHSLLPLAALVLTPCLWMSVSSRSKGNKKAQP